MPQQQPPPPPPQMQMPGPTNSFPPQQQQFMQQQQQPNAFQQQQPSNSFVSQGMQPIVPNPNIFQQPQQQQQYMQTMMNQQQQQPPPQYGQQQPLGSGPLMPNQPNNLSYNAPPGPGGWQQQQQPASQVPVDILGLADKAASAVQALANQGRLPLQQSAPGQMPPPPSGYPQHPQQPMLGSIPMPLQQQPGQQQYPLPPSYSGQQIAQQQQQPPRGPVYTGNPAQQQHRRRTTANLPDLPPMVQLAVQVRYA